jgi:hypothetical protein
MTVVVAIHEPRRGGASRLGAVEESLPPQGRRQSEQERGRTKGELDSAGEEAAQSRSYRRGCHLSSIPLERRPPELDSAGEDVAQAQFHQRGCHHQESRGDIKNLHQGPPPSTHSSSIGAGVGPRGRVGDELHRGLLR